MTPGVRLICILCLKNRWLTPVWRAVNVLFLLFKSNIFNAWKMTPDFRTAHSIQVSNVQEILQFHYCNYCNVTLRTSHLDVLGGGDESKKTYGQGGGFMYFVRYCGIRYVPLVFLFIKCHSFWGTSPPPPPQTPYIGLCSPDPLYPSSRMWYCLNHWGDIGNKICPILVKQKSFPWNVALFF